MSRYEVIAMLTESSETITPSLLCTLRAAYTLDWNGIHGIEHWLRVRENGFRVARETGADLVVVELFAFLHDIRRQDDGRDPLHGQRAADFARSLGHDLIPLNRNALEQLLYACAHHTDGTTEADITIQTCWDADRLDLGRVGIIPIPERLCTVTARRADVLEWAIRRSQNRAHSERPTNL